MSANIFKGQGGILISVETGTDLTSATVHKILCQDPNLVKGAFGATVSGTKLLYNAQPGDFNTEGMWSLQSFVTIAGIDYYGAVDTINVSRTLK